MSNEIKINGKMVAKVATVIKYVTINFVETINNTTTSTNQIPGMVLEKPTLAVTSTGNDNQYKYYKVLYSWKHQGVDAPMLVPNTEATYTSNFCNMKATNSKITLTLDEYDHQIQDKNFYIHADYPLYFKGQTNDGAIEKNVIIESTVLLDENNKYKMLIKIYINGVLVIPGTPKDFTVKVKIYKDYSCEKYIGYINVNVTMIKTTGPGE